LCGIAEEPFWPGGEIFRGVAHLGALQMADLGRQPLDPGGNQGECHEILGVAVARDHLGRDRLGFEPELLGDMGLDRRVDIGKGADRPRDGTGGDLPARCGEPVAVAGELGPVPGELQAKGRRLGMDAMAAADGRRQFMLEGAPLQRRQERIEIGQQQVGGLLQLHCKGGVEHVARGHPLMNETRLGADMLGEVGQERDHIVVGLALDCVDPFDLEGAALPDRARRALGDDAERRLGVAGICLDLEPDPEPVLRRPDSRHLRAAVAPDHGGVPRPAASGLAISTSSQYRPSCFSEFFSMPYSTKPSLA
jgi:hypothetical protein